MINGLGNLGGFCGPWLVGMMIYLYGQNVAVCALAGLLVIAALITLTLPKTCDLTSNNDGKPAAGKSVKQPRTA